jgi:hypothetical protein
MAAMQDKKLETSKNAVTLDKFKDARHLQNAETHGNWEDAIADAGLPEGTTLTIENLAQGEIESSPGRNDVTLAYTQWTQSFLTIANEEYDMEMTALYTSVDFNMTGVFYDGDKFESYLAYEDPENPGMTIGATCQI